MTQFAVKHTNGSFYTTRTTRFLANTIILITSDTTTLFNSFNEARHLANRLNKTDHNWFVVRFDPWTMPSSQNPVLH